MYDNRSPTAPKQAFVVKPTPKRRVSACLDDWIQAWRRGCSNSLRLSPESKGPASKATAFKHAGAAIAMRQQAAFEVTWRENRSLSLQPKVGGPSAAERMRALRQRLLARSQAGSCCEAPTKSKKSLNFEVSFEFYQNHIIYHTKPQ